VLGRLNGFPTPYFFAHYSIIITYFCV